MTSMALYISFIVTIMIDNLYYSDNELLKLIKEGSDEAFRQLFYKFYPRLLRYAVRYVNDEDIAEDILQDCFISFWEKSRALKNISISSLLFCMVRNACLNYIKHNSLIENVSVDYVFDIGGEEKLYSLDMQLTPDEILFQKELKIQISKAISLLSDRTKQVFVLSRFRGLKNNEIAEELNITTKAVEKHITKSLKIISSYLEKQSLDTKHFIIVSLFFLS